MKTTQLIVSNYLYFLGQISTRDLLQSPGISLKLGFLSKVMQRLRQNLLRVAIEFFQAVMGPFPVAPHFHEASFLQISQMAGDLGLIGLQNFLQVANANLPVFHQAEQAKPGFVRQRRKE